MSQTESPPSDQVPLRSPRRWFRFSLRTMLIFVTAIALLLWLWIVPSERQRRACKFIVNNHFGNYQDSPKQDDEWKWYQHYASSVDIIYLYAGDAATRAHYKEIDWAAFPKLSALKVSYLANSGTPHEIKESLVKLLSNPSFPKKLKSIFVFEYGSALDDEIMKSLSRFQDIETLEIVYGGFSYEGFQALANCKKLKSLRIINWKQTDLNLSAINFLKDLEVFQLKNSGKVFVEKADFTELKQLRDFELECYQISDATLQKIADAPLLQNLAIIEEDINDPSEIFALGLAAIGKMKSLKSFSINGHIIADGGLTALAKQTNVQKLELNCRLPYSELESFQHNTSLRELNLCTQSQWASVEDKDIDSILKLKNIRVLRMNGSRVTDVGLAKLAELEGLEELGISDTKITPEGLASLEKFKNLKKVEIDNGIKVNGRTQIKALQQLKPQLEVYSR